MTRSFISFRGIQSEEVAQRHLESQGWIVLEKNFRGSGFELDLVVHKAKTLVFVEVKGRNQTTFLLEEELISERKCRALQRGAAVFLETHAETAALLETFRFDLILVDLPSCRVVKHVENVFHLAV